MSLSCRSPRCPPTTSAGPNHGASPPGGGARDVVGLRQPRRQTGALAGMLGSAVLDDPSADKQGGDEPRRGDEACLSGEAAATSSAAARVGKKKGARRKAETANTTVCWVLHCPLVLTLGFFRSCLTQESGLSQREVSRWLLVGLDAPCYGYSCKTDCMTNGSYQHLVCSGAAIALRATCSACSLRSQTGTRLNADGSVRRPHGPRGGAPCIRARRYEHHQLSHRSLSGTHCAALTPHTISPRPAATRPVHLAPCAASTYPATRQISLLEERRPEAKLGARSNSFL